LSEQEQLKIAALRSISRQDADKAIPAMEKVIKEESNPALRYEAVRQLRRFLDDKRVVPILGKVAKDDKNVDVRKKAILLLGKSGDKRAVKILEELAER
jgi:HEAT repeat protein